MPWQYRRQTVTGINNQNICLLSIKRFIITEANIIFFRMSAKSFLFYLQAIVIKASFENKKCQ
jgi:hypothetical protein